MRGVGKRGSCAALETTLYFIIVVISLYLSHCTVEDNTLGSFARLLSCCRRFELEKGTPRRRGRCAAATVFATGDQFVFNDHTAIVHHYPGRGG